MATKIDESGKTTTTEKQAAESQRRAEEEAAKKQAEADARKRKDDTPIAAETVDPDSNVTARDIGMTDARSSLPPEKGGYPPSYMATAEPVPSKEITQVDPHPELEEIAKRNAQPLEVNPAAAGMGVSERVAAQQEAGRKLVQNAEERAERARADREKAEKEQARQAKKDK